MVQDEKRHLMVKNLKQQQPLPWQRPSQKIQFESLRVGIIGGFEVGEKRQQKQFDPDHPHHDPDRPHLPHHHHQVIYLGTGNFNPYLGQRL